MSGSLEAEGTRLVVEHTFADHRPAPYTVQLTVSAMSEAGRVTGSDTLYVRVVEAERFVSSGWDISGTFKTAVRALTAFAQASIIVLIWVAVFSPVLLVLGGVVYLANRRQRQLVSRARAQMSAPAGETGADAAAEAELQQADTVESDEEPPQPDTEERR